MSTALVLLNVLISLAGSTVYSYAMMRSRARGHRLLSAAFGLCAAVCLAFALGYVFLYRDPGASWVAPHFFRPLFWLLVGGPSYVVYRLVKIQDERVDIERETAKRLLGG